MVTLPIWRPIFMSHTFLGFLSPRHLGISTSQPTTMMQLPLTDRRPTQQRCCVLLWFHNTVFSLLLGGCPARLYEGCSGAEMAPPWEERDTACGACCPCLLFYWAMWTVVHKATRPPPLVCELGGLASPWAYPFLGWVAQEVGRVGGGIELWEPHYVGWQRSAPPFTQETGSEHVFLFLASPAPE